MTADADGPFCLGCSKVLRWLSTSFASGWSLLGEQRFTCYTDAKGFGRPHRVLAPPLENRGELEKWLDS